MTRVSVVMPVFNAAAHLQSALESLRRQTEPNFELIAINDGSTDSTPNILESAAADPRLKIIQTPHQGIVAALNTGLGASTAPYIARIDADDLATPERLSLQAAFLDRHPEIGLVSGQVDYLGDAQKNQGLAHYVEWANSVATEAEISAQRFVESPLIHPSVMFRRELISRHGGYREGPFPEDYELWLRWLDQGVRMSKIPETVLSWRDRSNRLTRTDSRYSVPAFYEVKTTYLYRWLERHNPFHPEIIIWGSGRVSRQRLCRLLTLGAKVTAWVDISPRKIGASIAGVPVIAPQDLPPPGRAFILLAVGSRGARDQMRTRIEASGHQVISHFLPCA